MDVYGRRVGSDTSNYVLRQRSGLERIEEYPRQVYRFIGFDVGTLKLELYRLLGTHMTVRVNRVETGHGLKYVRTKLA